MRGKLFGATADGMDPFERRFGLKRSKLPANVRAAVDTLMAETAMLTPVAQGTGQPDSA